MVYSERKPEKNNCRKKRLSIFIIYRKIDTEEKRTKGDIFSDAGTCIVNAPKKDGIKKEEEERKEKNSGPAFS